ncbi:unnamed protein product [Oikopleura dioica]|uniref:Uncharacterized protein n=1 Tax=Oikopleura dioica TaxID=34765 RepID=E4Y9X3_OIKDI|nr:unnamed protein product [Oikopleura dioica]
MVRARHRFRTSCKDKTLIQIGNQSFKNQIF